MTKQYDNYADLITFTRASGGTALRHVGYGTELVTNGTFDDGTTGFGVIGGASISYSAGENALEVNVTGSGGGFAETPTLATTIGKVYLVSITVKKTTFSGNIHWNIDGVNQGSFTPTTEYQTFSKPFVATDASLDVGFPRESSPTGIYFVREVSVKEVIFDRATDPLVLFNHPTNTPRIEYDADGNRKGLLIEEARTNLLTYSEQFDNAAWIKSQLTVTPDTVTAPSGTTTAETFARSATNSSEGRVRFITAQPVSTAHTLSCFVKANTSGARLFLRNLAIDNSTATGVVQFNPADGTISTAFGSTFTGKASMVPVGNGWWRCSITGTTPASIATNLVDIGVTDGSTAIGGVAGDSIYIYGAQLEAGSFPTSYIPTAGATATRAADVASIPTSAFGYNAKIGAGGTVIADFQSDNWRNAPSTEFSRVWDFSGTNNNGLFRDGPTGDGNRFRYRLNDTSGNAVLGADTISNLVANSDDGAKIAIAYEKDNFAVYANGTQHSLDPSGLFANEAATILYLGVSNNGSSQFANGHIKSIQYYPRRLTNAQLQELTA